MISVAVAMLILNTLQPALVSASTMADFNSSNIISNSTIRDTSTMSTAQIQSFLNNINPTCKVSVCLKNYAEDNTSASQIIKNASSTHSINPQVLLAILETQYRLISSDSPDSTWYADAMGMPSITGFTDQINAAANYLSDITTNNNGLYQQGISSNIPINVNPACGTLSISIQNTATAALYSYPGLDTPQIKPRSTPT